MKHQVAVIGAGAMGRNHIRIYKELGVLSAISDANVETGSTLAKTYGVPFYQSVEQLLDTKPTAVSVAVPTPFHLKVASMCLKASVPTLLEKPIAPTIEEAEALVALADATGTILTIGYIENYNPIFRELKELIRTNAFGDITSVSIKRVGGIPRSADNVILDLMTHDFNLLLDIFGRTPEKIYTHRRKNNNLIDSAQVLLDFGSASATCEANWLSPIKIREIWITGTNGYARVDMIRQEITRYEGLSVDSSHRRMEVKALRGEPLKLELQAFLAAIETGDASGLVSAKDGLETLKLTLQAAGV